MYSNHLEKIDRQLAQAVDIIRPRVKRIYIFMIKVNNKLLLFFHWKNLWKKLWKHLPVACVLTAFFHSSKLITKLDYEVMISTACLAIKSA